MQVFSPDKIRNVALVGQNAVGKTTLIEGLLYRAGLVNRPGTVEEGNTVSDFDPEEQKRTQSLSLSVIPVEWRGHKLNLIDTPGYADFIGDVHAALRAADLAVFVVSAVDGVEPQTAKIWAIAEELALPRMIFINKMDKEHASFDRTMGELREHFGSAVTPLELPVGEEGDFHGVADLLTEKAWIYDSGKAQQTDIPPEMADREHEEHDHLVEGIVETDDELLEHYLEGEEPSPERLAQQMAIAVRENAVFPVLEGSATGPIGVDRLADFICDLGPSPLQRPPVSVTAGDTTVEISPDPGGDPLVFVFKTIADPYVGQITLFRVWSGTVDNDDHLYNHATGADERFHAISVLRGKDQIQVPSIPAGDIGAVTKLNETRTGDTLAPRDKPVAIAPIARPEPVLAVAITASSKGDETKLATALHRLQDEDPALDVQRNDETKQTLLRGMGEVQIGITLEKLRRKFGLEVDTDEVKVPYRETIKGYVEAEGKHKKQTGGHGQFGVAIVKMEPTARGSGFEFVDEIKGGSIPRQFIPAVEKGLRDAMSDGGPLGFPVVDMRVYLIDGKYHSVDSSEMSFQMAGKLAFREGSAKAGSLLLEPISLIQVTVPERFQGDIMGDLSARRGRLQGTTAGAGTMRTITALVPTSEIMRYSIDLRSMTGGWGSFTARHDHYDVVPDHLVARAVADRDND